MKLEILSRSAIETRARQPFAPGTALISITDTALPPPRLAHKPEYFLPLFFDDLTPQEVRERLGLPEELQEDPKLMAAVLSGAGVVLFDRKMAANTARFLLDTAAAAETVLCQCDWGQSRSAAVAAAIAEFYAGKGQELFQDPRYGPNPWVYGLLLSALRRVRRRQLLGNRS